MFSIRDGGYESTAPATSEERQFNTGELLIATLASGFGFA
jgi:hypothetical protein